VGLAEDAQQSLANRAVLSAIDAHRNRFNPPILTDLAVADCAMKKVLFQPLTAN
jgi:hypothetical protein